MKILYKCCFESTRKRLRSNNKFKKSVAVKNKHTCTPCDRIQKMNNRKNRNKIQIHFRVIIFEILLQLKQVNE